MKLYAPSEKNVGVEMTGASGDAPTVVRQIFFLANYLEAPPPQTCFFFVLFEDKIVNALFNEILKN